MKNQNLRYSLRLTILAATAFALVTGAQAEDFITGYGWATTAAITNSPGGSPDSLVLGTCAQNAGPAPCTAANADVSFTTSGLNFGASGFPDGGTVAQWLSSSGFALNNLVDNIPTALMGGPGTIWQFIGTAHFVQGTGFDVAHDDGATFIVNGDHLLDEPGPTSPVTNHFTYTGPTGDFAFEIDYAECCGGPAQLVTNLVGPENGIAATPEPATFILTGTGMLAFGLFRKRRS